MVMIKKPPTSSQLPANPFDYIFDNQPERFADYLTFHQPMDDKNQYFHYDEFRHRVPQGLNVNIAWALTKKARLGSRLHLLDIVPSIVYSSYISTPFIQKTISLVDQNTTNAALEWTIKKLGEEQHLQYLLSDMVEGEAISSSQLEGAATTTLVAKDMLRRKREPRNMGERMILGNWEMMQFSWNNCERDLTPELIQELHRIGVEDIDDDRYTPGVFRKDDNVVVEDRDGDVVHQPPAAKDLESRLKIFCKWVNGIHDEVESTNYIHPLLKAIIIHFVIGYEHPFRDGNGRVARALFYWFMFKKDYGAFRYISISNLLKDAATQYGKSYLYTETDDMDMTYFIDYQCSVIMRSVSAFKSHCQKAIKDIEAFNQWLWKSGIYKQLNDKQKTVFQVAKSNIATEFTATNVKENLGCSYNTASTVLNGLVDLNLFGKKKDGREWVFYLLDKNHIQNQWKA
jgi:Fic family protein